MQLKGIQRKVLYLVTKDNRCPFKEWIGELPLKLQSCIDVRITRLGLGNPGKSGTGYRDLGSGLFELKVSPKGFETVRVYFTVRGNELVMVLSGGGKKSQNADIKMARHLISDYLKET